MIKVFYLPYVQSNTYYFVFMALIKDNAVNRLHISQVYNDYLFPAEERGDRYERTEQPHRDDHQEHSIPIQIFLSLLCVYLRERVRERE